MRKALDNGEIRELSQLRPWKSAAGWAFVLVQLVLLLALGQYLLQRGGTWWAFPFLLFLIAGRQGALLQLVHEGSHRLLSKDSWWNNNFAYWLCAAPIGVNFFGYAANHRQHHAHAGTAEDPKSDTEKYRITDVKDWRLYLLFLKDISTITALSTFFAYQDRSGQVHRLQREGPGFLRHFAQLCVVQLVLLGLLFRFDIFAYVLLWLVPAMSPHMVLMRVRGMAEHGLPQQLHLQTNSTHDGIFYTRSFLTPTRSYGFTPFVWLEKALIGSFAVHFHHEHHLYPNVPYYHLRGVHEKLAAGVEEANPNTYMPGYFAAAFGGPRVR